MDWFIVGKFHGPLTIMAALPSMNCVDAAGVWLQWRQSLDAEPSLMSWFHTFSACTPGAEAMLENVALPPLLQKNGSHCQVVSSAASQVSAMP